MTAAAPNGLGRAYRLWSVCICRRPRFLVKNDVEFRMYRKFGTETTIKFETPEPAPEEKIKEQPVQ